LKDGSFAKVAVVENRAGAGDQIAVQPMKGAPTDGSVILQTPASMLMIYPYIYKKLAYDPFVDVTAITMACTFDFAWAVGPAVPPTRPRRTSARRRRVRCRISSACCSAGRPASS
jgi:tripartite-type tricarboxylate transporter receptor subunit TctC